MKNLFVSYEFAKKAKERSFDEPCLFSWFQDKTIASTPEWLKYNSRSKTLISAPLHQQLVDWFREVHEIHIEIYSNHSGWGYILTKLNGTTIKEIEDDIFYDDFYSALNKGFEESFKLIQK